MKILLVGEYSGLHNNLSSGLKNLGYDVRVAADGDNWKNIPHDLPILGKGKSKVARLWSLLKFFTKVRGYDVVQLISVEFFSHRWSLLNFMSVLLLKILNKKIFFLAAGCDPIYFRAAKRFAYSPCHDCQKIDLKGSCQHASESHYFFCKILIHFSNGIIPCAVDYWEGTKQFKKGLDPITFPAFSQINVCEKNTNTNGKIKILYGKNRDGFKGTEKILKAIELLPTDIKEKIDVKITNRMSFKDYLKEVGSCDILIDQCNSQSYGMNAILGLQMGKIVLSGDKHFNGVENKPVFKITPDEQQIAAQITKVVLDIEKGKLSHSLEDIEQYIDLHHSPEIVAQHFLNRWIKT